MSHAAKKNGVDRRWCVEPCKKPCHFIAESHLSVVPENEPSLQNNRKLLIRKSANHFQLLTDGEVLEMEEAIRAGYSSTRTQ